MLHFLNRLVGHRAPPRSTFNPDVERVLCMRTKPVVSIHVGKCAGSSVRTALLQILPRDHTLHEMHCYDANRRIATVLDKDDGRVDYLICARDPIDRFISAFNWDKHNLYFEGHLTGTQEGAGYDRFPTIHALAGGLRSRNEAERQAATDLATSERLHMGMGQNWYTPLEIIERLPRERTTVIYSHAATSGLLEFASAYDYRHPGPTRTLPRGKSTYKFTYPDHERISPTSLSQEHNSALRDCIAHDLRACHTLLTLPQRPGNR